MGASGKDEILWCAGFAEFCAQNLANRASQRKCRVLLRDIVVTETAIDGKRLHMLHFVFPKNQNKQLCIYIIRTRMHSSGMLTVRSSSRLSGGGLPQCMLGYPPGGRPPQSRHPQDQAPLWEQAPQRSRPSRSRPPETCCKACWDTTCNACWDSTYPRPAARHAGILPARHAGIPPPLWTDTHL